jgi:hypothetical protein
MYPPESELNHIILSALPHSPTISFVWSFSVLVFFMVLFAPRIPPASAWGHRLLSVWKSGCRAEVHRERRRTGASAWFRQTDVGEASPKPKVSRASPRGATRPRFFIKSFTAFLAGSAFFVIANYFVDQQSTHDARLLSKILAEGDFHIWMVDDGEEIEIQGKDPSKKLFLGISHAKRIDEIFKTHGMPFLSLAK